MRAVDPFFAARDDEPPVGARVVVRAHLAAPDRFGHTLTDVVGELLSVTSESLTVAGRAGPVTIARSAVTIVKVVPPAPIRRGAPHRAITVNDLERITVDAWRPSERERLGDWILRAAAGFTRRANSCLAIGEADRPLPDAIDGVEQWYAARSQPARFALAGPVGFDPDEHPSGALLRQRRYLDQPPVLVLTARTGVVAAGSRGALPVDLATTPDAQWMAGYAQQRMHDHESALPVLLGSPEQYFARVRDDDGILIGIGRLAVAHAWGGISCMWVSPRARRRGVARALLSELAARASMLGARSLHLQVAAANESALELYLSRGFVAHHAYVYADAPTRGQSSLVN